MIILTALALRSYHVLELAERVIPGWFELGADDYIRSMRALGWSLGWLKRYGCIQRVRTMHELRWEITGGGRVAVKRAWAKRVADDTSEGQVIADLSDSDRNRLRLHGG